MTATALLLALVSLGGSPSPATNVSVARPVRSSQTQPMYVAMGTAVPLRAAFQPGTSSGLFVNAPARPMLGTVAAGARSPGVSPALETSLRRLIRQRFCTL